MGADGLLTNETRTDIMTEPAPNKAAHSPLPWSLSGQAGDQYIMARQPEGRIRVAEVFCLYDRELIVRAVNNADKLAEALLRFCNAYQMESDHDLECAEAEASKALAAYEADRA